MTRLVIPRGRRNALGLAAAAAAAAIGACLHLRTADAQKIDPRRPAVFVVGAPSGPSPTIRGDARRSGSTKDALPTGTLRVAWRKTIGLTIDQPALAGPDGTLAVVTTRGDVVFLDDSGEERGRASSGTTSIGPATMTSDGTVVFVSSAGDAIGIRRSSPRPRFVYRIGGERNLRAAPLSLDDGGVVVATATDLVVLDSEGNVRARTALAETPSSPLLASGDKVVAIGPSGTVFGWVPGREPARLGSFGGAIDGGAALSPTGSLLAVVEGNHLVELDLARGVLSSRAVAAQGLYLGPPSIRADSSKGLLATLLSQTPSRAFVVTLDPGGAEVQRAPVASLVPVTLADGGPAPLVARPHIGPLVDARGAVAFAAPDGKVGLLAPQGNVDTIGELLCSQTAQSARIAGLTAAGTGAFAVTCEAGVVVKINGQNADSPKLRPSSPLLNPSPRRSPGPAPSSSADQDD